MKETGRRITAEGPGEKFPPGEEAGRGTETGDDWEEASCVSSDHRRARSSV